MNQYKSFPVQIRASFWFLICAFFQRGISFITTPVFTRLLSTTEYGQYNVFQSWLSIISVIVTLNLYAGVYTSGLVKFEDKRKEFSSAFQGLALTLVLIWIVIYWIKHEFWNGFFSLTSVQMMFMFLIMWTSVVFSFWAMEQRVDFKYRRLITVTIIVSIIQPAVSIVLVLVSKDKVTARIAGTALVQLFCYIWFFFSQMYRGGRFYSKEVWRYALAFNIPLIPHYLSTCILNSADRIMIGRMVNDSAAGIYSLAYSISMIMTMFNTALMQTIEPWLYKKIKEKKVEVISSVAYPAFLIVAFVNILLIALAPEAIKIFAPDEYYEAIYVIPPVAMSVFFMFSFTFFAVFEFYYNETKQIAFATTVGALLNVILNYIFIRVFGYIAAGYTTLVCYIVYTIFHYRAMHKICSEQFDDIQPYNVRIYMAIAISFIVVGFIFLFSYCSLVLRYGILVALAILLACKRRTIITAITSIMSIREKQ